MKNAMKRILSLILAVCLLGMSFMACSKNEAPAREGKDTGSTEAASSDTKTAEEASVVANSAKPSGKIVVWGWEYIQKSLEGNMEAFQAEYPDIEVEFQISATADLYQKMLLGLSAGGEGLPDVAAVETSNLAQFVDVGGLMDITDKVAAYKNKMNAYKWADASKNGKIYAMPWDSGPVALYYRTDVFEKAGLPSDPEGVSDLLKTWDDYYAVAKTIKEKTGAFMLQESQEKPTGRNFEKLLWQQGAFYFDETGVPLLNSPEAVKSMTFITELVKSGLADNTEEWTQPWYDGLSNGTVATIIGASWMGGFLTSWIAPDAVGLWKVVPLPTWAGSTNSGSNDGGSNLVISDTSENKEAAWAYVEFMLGREESQINAYKSMDAFPSLETTYTDEFFDEEIEYFGNQKVRRVFANSVSQIPVLSYTKNYSRANESLKEAYVKIIFKNISIEQALEEANEQVKVKIE